MNDDSDLIIKFEDVTKSYRDLGAILALSGINLSVRLGERVAVMGPSGSGKSTLLNLMCGLDRPTLGSIFFEGRNLAQLNDDDRTRLRRERVGMIFQTFNLMPTLNAVENVALPLRLAGVAGGAAAEKARAMLGRVGLDEKAGDRPDEMSGGERQRVAIARALIFDPPLLLADEPTGNLDSRTGDEVLSLLEGLHREFNTTILMVTHDERAAAHCERHITLLDGEITKDERITE